MRIHAVRCFGAILLAIAAGCDAQRSAPAYAAMFNGGVPAPEARGVWQSRGYGWIIDLRDNGFTVYHRSAAGCSADPRIDDFSANFAFRDTATPPGQLALAVYPGENRYVFDRIDRLPRECSRTDWTPKRMFEHFAASYREHYAFFKQRAVDWETRVAANRPLVTNRTSPRVLFAIFSDMLDGLGDPHVVLNGRFRGEPLAFRSGRGVTLQRINDVAARNGQSPTEARARWEAAYARGIRDTVLGGKFQEAGSGKVLWGRIGNDIGYINVTAVEGFDGDVLERNVLYINRLMDRILAEFDGVRAVIVDITKNVGGYDRLAREIAGHFAVERTLAYTKRAYGAKGTDPDVFFVEPSTGRRFTGPVYLLTSDVTASGGEILAMTMRVLPNVMQIGTPTRGALSDRLLKVLPDGSEFSISNEIYLDAEGRLFEAVGVPPHKQLAIFPADDPENGHAKAVMNVVEQIR
jgi:carboxyl-terminal processing protease